MAQKILTHQDLIDLYLLNKESVIKKIEEKGYKPFEPLLNSLGSNALFFRRNDSSEIFFALASQRITDLFYSDLLENLHTIVAELKDSGWSLKKKRDGIFEVYKKETVDFLIVFQIKLENEKPMIQIMEKF